MSRTRLQGSECCAPYSVFPPLSRRCLPHIDMHDNHIGVLDSPPYGGRDTFWRRLMSRARFTWDSRLIQNRHPKLPDGQIKTVLVHIRVQPHREKYSAS